MNSVLEMNFYDYICFVVNNIVIDDNFYDPCLIITSTNKDVSNYSVGVKVVILVDLDNQD